MSIFKNGEWLPDRGPLDNDGCTIATNVYPGSSGFTPVGQYVSVTDALDARPRGAIQLKDDADLIYQFAGDAAKLYQNIANVWTDRSISGGYSTGSNSQWEFAAWKNQLLAVNFDDDPQKIELGGTIFSNLTTALKARHITVVRDFVVMANTNDSVDGDVTSRVRWSGYNDETSWTVSTITLAGFQDLKTGSISRIFGGEYGVIFQKNAVWRMTFVGAPVAFQFDEVLPAIGLIAPGAAARLGQVIYFLSEKGFYALDRGSGVTPIGFQRVDKTILDDLDTDYLDRISAVADPQSHRILFAYPGQGNVAGRPNKIAVYDTALDQWSIIEQELEWLWNSGGTGTTMEGLDAISSDLDALGVSLDASRWYGEAAIASMFDSTFKSGFFDGGSMEATIETREYSLNKYGRAVINGFRPLIEGGACVWTARLGHRNALGSNVQYTDYASPRVEELIRVRVNSRYQRFSMKIAAGCSWDFAMGIQLDDLERKRMGRRG